MTNRNKGILLILIGVVVGIVSLSADYLGFGAHPEIIGWKQLLLAAVGFVMILVGVWLVSRKTD